MSVSQLAQTFGSLLLLFAILYLVLKLSKMHRTKKYTGDIQIIDRLPLDTSSSLIMVSVRGKNLLLSLTGKSVSVLERFE